MRQRQARGRGGLEQLSAEGRVRHMAKGYWVARVDVNNEDGYEPYAAANAAIFKKFGGRFLVRGGKFDVAEGNSRARNVIIEFPDYASARACYRSPEYQENIKVRQPHSTIKLMVIHSPECGCGYARPPLPAALVRRGTVRMFGRPRSRRTGARVCLFRG